METLLNIDRLLAYLSMKGIRLWVERGRIQYRGPDAVLTPELLDQLTQNKAAIIAHLRETGPLQPSYASIPTAPRAVGVPLSPYQEAFWFLDQIRGGNPCDHIAKAFRIDGALNLEALEHGFSEIVGRHEILRTKLSLFGDNPEQEICSSDAIQIEHCDLRDIDSDAREAEARRICAEAASRRFDLKQGPHFRVKLLRLGDEDWVLVVVMHHIISDGESFQLLFDELEQLYKQYQGERSVNLPELSIQYADFSVWQRQNLESEAVASQVGYWRDQLGDEDLVLELPTDKPRPVEQSPYGAKRSISVSKNLCDQLARIGREEGVTLFMMLFAAVQALLHRYTGQDRIAIGTPVSLRNHVEFESLIGLFVNMLVLRTPVSGDLTFRQLLRHVRGVVLESQSNQELPFNRLVNILQPDRDLSRNPLFQVMLQVSPMPKLRLSGTTVEPFEFDSGISQFDLSIHLFEDQGRLQGYFEYDTDLFDPARIDRMAGHFETLLRGFVDNPDAPLAKVPMLTSAERDQLLIDWNQTANAYPSDRTIHQLFEEQVQRTPDAPAIARGPEQLNYRDLNTRANCLAHHLRELGVGPDRLVGIALERSVDMLVAVLATLKAGGAYVPMDPSLPKDRLAFMLEDSGPAVVITKEATRERFVGDVAALVFLDRDRESIEAYPIDNPSMAVTPDNLAYVIYTSGSTGAPKGVMVPHRAVVNFVGSMARKPGMTARDRIAAVTTLSFDIHVLELLQPLTVGASIVLASREDAADGAALTKILTDSGCTMMQATPATWQLLLEAGWTGPPGFKALCGGEALSSLLATQLIERTDQLWNMYGPTETTVWSTCGLIYDKSEVSIGRPIDNTHLYVLDRHLIPVPIGIPGELYIGGAGIGRGYLGRTQLSTQCFIDNPFGSGTSSRLYKTGDLVTYRPDGTLDFIQRVDDQIKLRGFRIEPGEIEAVLSRHGGVRQAAVVVREDEPGDKRLVGYVVTAGTVAPTVGDLRSYLLDTLPDYMVPSNFVVLESLPLTPNGKVDKGSLPAPDSTRPALETAYVEPRNEIEATIVGIWGDLLRVDDVGIHDNFFALGGHSLLLMQMRSRLRQSFQREVPIVELFRHPTVDRLAAFLNTGADDEVRLHPAHMILPRIPRGSRAPLSPEQRPLFSLHQIRGGNPYDHVSYAIRIEGGLNLEALEHGFSRIVERHEVLRTTFHAEATAAYQEILAPTPVRISQLDLRDIEADLREVKARDFCATESRRHFDLEQAPLFRVSLIRLEDQSWVLLVVIHHIVTDGESFGLIFKELEELYTAFEAKRAPRLPELQVQYADFAVWQIEALESGALSPQSAYWKGQLFEDFPPLDLPTDGRRPAVQSGIGARRSISVPLTLCERLAKLGQAENATLFMTLLTAVDILLYRYSGQSTIAVGIPMSIRRQVEIEPLVGLFINFVVHRTEVRADLTFRQLLRLVSRSAMESYGHADLPFDELVRLLDTPPDLSRNPLFQVMFNFNTRAPISLPGLEVTRFEFERGTSQFDLSINLFEDAQGVEGYIEYDTDLFHPGRIERMAGHFDVLLRGIVAHPDCPIVRLSIMTEAERHHVLVGCNRTEIPRQAGETLHGLFETAVAKTPDVKALLTDDGSFSLAELEGWTNHLATKLTENGVGPGEIVAICCKRSPRAVAGLLAILKCGAAYLPLDPTYPKGRLKYMLEDSRASVLLAEEDLLSLLPSTVPKCIILDDSNSRPAGGPFHCPRLTDDAAAYVVYTSGSTGKPKGVVGTHRGIVNRLQWMWEHFPFDEGEISAQTTSLGFVDHLWEIFGPLLNGYPLRFFDAEELLDCRAFVDRLRRSGVTRLTLVPSHLRAILDAKENDEQQLRYLRICFTSGEALAPDLAERFFSAVPNARLVNLYGSSEVAADVTAHEVTPDDVAAGKMPIGRPIDNVELYVLDRERHPVPIGIPGELYVGGCQLAQGYLHRPELTAAQFPTVEIAGLPPRHLYRTGDVVRYRPSGILDYLGRTDQQIKLRGIRIEPGEIESALRAIPGVREAVVLVQGEGASRQLRAFVTRTENGDLSDDLLRAQLGKTLPSVMVPSDFQVLDELPLTPSGKFDRLELLELADSIDASEEPVAPRNHVERELARLWSDILNRPAVSIHDNFFEIGGNSLLVMLFVARARQVDLIVTPRQLFETQTIAQLAQVVHVGKPVNVKQEDRTGDVPLAHNQLRFLKRGSPNPHHWNVSLRCESRLDLDPALLKEAFAAVIDAHGALSLRFASGTQGWQQHLTAESGEVPLQTFEIDSLGPESVERFITEEVQSAQGSLDLTAGPVLRLLHFKMGPRKADQIVLIVHHLVCDRLSMAILMGDLQVAYLQRLSRSPSHLPSADTSYPAWVRSLRDYVNSTAGEAQARRWLALPWSDVQPLPRDLPGSRMNNTNAAARAIPMEWTSDQTKCLLEHPKYRPQELLLAALHGALAKWMGSRTVLIDLLQHGRDPVNSEMNLSRTVGMFIGYATSLLTSDPEDPGTHLQRIVDQARESGELPWSLDVFRYLAESECFASRCKALPFAEVLFNYRGASIGSSRDDFLTIVSRKPEDDFCPTGLRGHALSVVFDVIDGRLRGAMVYCERYHRGETIEGLWADYRDRLLRIQRSDLT